MQRCYRLKAIRHDARKKMRKHVARWRVRTVCTVHDDALNWILYDEGYRSKHAELLNRRTRVSVKIPLYFYVPFI